MPAVNKAKTSIAAPPTNAIGPRPATREANSEPPKNAANTPRTISAIIAPCPSGMGAMIALMVLGVFAAFFGGSLFASRVAGRGPMAFVGGAAMLVFALFTAGIAAAVIGIVDLHDDDTRPGYEI